MFTPKIDARIYGKAYLKRNTCEAIRIFFIPLTTTHHLPVTTGNITFHPAGLHDNLA